MSATSHDQSVFEWNLAASSVSTIISTGRSHVALCKMQTAETNDGSILPAFSAVIAALVHAMPEHGLSK